MRECEYCDATKEYEDSLPKHIDIVFDGPPGPEAGRFVEVENDEGQSIAFGDWMQRADGYWVLRINPRHPMPSAPRMTEPELLRGLEDLGLLPPAIPKL